MTIEQKSQYQMRYAIEDYTSFLSKKRATQMAHRIANTKVNREKYGSRIIDHNFNLVPVCDLQENSRVNIGNRELVCMDLVKIINNYGKRNLKVIEINDLLDLNY